MIQNPKEARQLASYILDNFEFYGEFYFKLEDWLTEVLQGNKPEIPSVEGMVTSTVIKEIKVVDALPDVEEPDVLYLVRESGE